MSRTSVCTVYMDEFIYVICICLCVSVYVCVLFPTQTKPPCSDCIYDARYTLKPHLSSKAIIGVQVEI